MAKMKINISVDEELVKEIDERVKEGTFRNRSHGFELSTKKHLAQQESG